MDTAKGQLNPKYKVILMQLTEEQFNEFILPYLSVGRCGPRSPTSLYRIFHYILSVLYTGMQWRQILIQLKENGKPEIHYSRVFRIYKRWVNDGSLEKLFNSSVLRLKENDLLDLSILHGDGSSTPAKKVAIKMNPHYFPLH